MEEVTRIHHPISSKQWNPPMRFTDFSETGVYCFLSAKQDYPWFTPAVANLTTTMHSKSCPHLNPLLLHFWADILSRPEHHISAFSWASCEQWVRMVSAAHIRGRCSTVLDPVCGVWFGACCFTHSVLGSSLALYYLWCRSWWPTDKLHENPKILEEDLKEACWQNPTPVFDFGFTNSQFKFIKILVF